MKKLLSMLLVFVMTFSLSIPSAWAAEVGKAGASQTTTNGQYENGVWKPGVGDGTVTHHTEDLDLTLSKTAKATEESNVFDITMQVQTVTKTTMVPPGAAATVLVVDVSGSMRFCAECGGDEKHEWDCPHRKEGRYVKDEQKRMTVAKNATIGFLDSYKGDTPNVGRYVAVVAFSTEGRVEQKWVDVSTAEGYNQAVAAVSELNAKGGTNLDDGLRHATALLQDKMVASIARAQKNVIALTDGAPTYYIGKDGRVHGDGAEGSERTNNSTAAS